MGPRGWSEEETERRYADYVARKDDAGLTPRTRASWEGAVGTLGEAQRRGDAFRDLVFESLSKRGFDASAGWACERGSPAAGQSRSRRLDIVNVEDDIGIECKVGATPRSRLESQLSADIDAADAFGDRIWVCADLGKDPAAAERLQRAADLNPDFFAVVDLADPTSINAFTERGTDEAQMAEAFTEARVLFGVYEHAHAEAAARGEEFSVQQTRAVWTTTQAVDMDPIPLEGRSLAPNPDDSQPWVPPPETGHASPTTVGSESIPPPEIGDAPTYDAAASWAPPPETAEVSTYDPASIWTYTPEAAGEPVPGAVANDANIASGVEPDEPEL